MGASLIAVTPMLEVAVPVAWPPPLSSVTVQVTVRPGSDPKSLGLWLDEENVTVSSTA